MPWFITFWIDVCLVTFFSKHKRQVSGYLISPFYAVVNFSEINTFNRLALDNISLKKNIFNPSCYLNKFLANYWQIWLILFERCHASRRLCCLGVNLAFCRETSVRFGGRWSCTPFFKQLPICGCSSVVTKAQGKIQLWQCWLVLVTDRLHA